MRIKIILTAIVAAAAVSAPVTAASAGTHGPAGSSCKGRYSRPTHYVVEVQHNYPGSCVSPHFKVMWMTGESRVEISSVNKTYVDHIQWTSKWGGWTLNNAQGTGVLHGYGKPRQVNIRLTGPGQDSDKSRYGPPGLVYINKKLHPFWYDLDVWSKTNGSDKLRFHWSWQDSNYAKGFRFH